MIDDSGAIGCKCKCNAVQFGWFRLVSFQCTVLQCNVMQCNAVEGDNDDDNDYKSTTDCTMCGDRVGTGQERRKGRTCR
jgi:hypothetical protein